MPKLITVPTVEYFAGTVIIGSGAAISILNWTMCSGPQSSKNKGGTALSIAWARVFLFLWGYLRWVILCCGGVYGIPAVFLNSRSSIALYLGLWLVTIFLGSCIGLDGVV